MRFKKKIKQKNEKIIFFEELNPQKGFFMSLHDHIESSSGEKISDKIRPNLRNTGKTKEKVIALSKIFFEVFQTQDPDFQSLEFPTLTERSS